MPLMACNTRLLPESVMDHPATPVADSVPRLGVRNSSGKLKRQAPPRDSVRTAQAGTMGRWARLMSCASCNDLTAFFGGRSAKKGFSMTSSEGSAETA